MGLRLEVLPLYDVDTGDCMAYYAKGTISPMEFATAVRREYEERVYPSKVKHFHARCVPARRSEVVDTVLVIHVEPGKQGAFPVTYIDLDENHAAFVGLFLERRGIKAIKND